MSVDPARAAYEARFANMTLGPRGAAPAWDDLPPEGRAVWQRVAEAARQGQLTVAEHKKLVAATEAAFAALRTEHQEALCDLGDRVDEIVRLREALKPFVAYARYALADGFEGEIGEVIVDGLRRSISMQDLRRAAEVYGAASAQEGGR
ncbi:hypothetical protein [Methylobacterium nodulans]|uniref:Uncharacterized protein n=1 Tax=Methylobacterium nodulans (strain LMG 21967 / CNCM I-2342 / ORS 2060) TaxID=460265 RepID=B8IV37_METNO|nr:hypothetical protein [Methylobacterium nodulans]ACL59095.1 hypothetical protein Mnod_4219 [Methylobacterium nodulans ORS 2060]